MITSIQQNIDRDGFALIERVVQPSSQADASLNLQELATLLSNLATSEPAAGTRNLLSRSAQILSFATSDPLYSLAQSILQTPPRPVRAILFDKTPDTNWYVTWHQDLSIPVQEKDDLPGYTPWSTKHGILHVQPPRSILEHMVSLRIHIDPCGEDNGPIKFIAGSHRHGVLNPEQIAELRDNQPHITCTADAGDIIAMRPLILHSSSVATSPNHRRVLHIEYAGIDLPTPLQWARA